jgi:hypothetical protein
LFILFLKLWFILELGHWLSLGRWLFVVRVDEHNGVIRGSILLFLGLQVLFLRLESLSASPNDGDAIFVAVEKDGSSLG